MGGGKLGGIDNNGVMGKTFGEYLVSTGVVRRGAELYHVQWVKMFIAMREVWQPGSWKQQLPLYLNYLRASGRAKGWQIQQAEQAVTLYFSGFRDGKE